jgi:hypothetical protein
VSRAPFALGGARVGLDPSPSQGRLVGNDWPDPAPGPQTTATENGSFAGWPWELYVATATRVDSPLRWTIEASAYPAAVGGGCGVVVVGVVVVGVVVVVVGVVVVVVVVVVGGGLADPPLTVAIGAHQPANASPHVTTTLPVPVDVL